MRNEQNKRLYIDLAEYGGTTRYTILNTDLLLMLWQNYNLSNIEQSIFLYICMVYGNANESGREPIKLSYTDIAKIINCSDGGVRKAIANLIAEKLLLAIGERKGKAKTKYVPNVEKLHNELLRYCGLKNT